MTVEFELDGHRFISFQVLCDSQEEIDFYWEKLGARGDLKARQCGWLKDRFGLSWQIVPRNLDTMFAAPESESHHRAFTAMLGMKKLDIAELEGAYEG